MEGKLKFITKNVVASDIWQLHFVKPSGFSHRAGQFIELNLPNGQADDRGTKRWFTISSAPDDSDIIITTRHVATKPSTFKQDIFDFESGDEIDFKGPDGKFVAPTKDAKLLWIAGGIGATPFISQLQSFLSESDLSRDIKLILGLRSLEEHPCMQLIRTAEQEMVNFSSNIVLSDVIPSGWSGKSGLIDLKLICDICPDYKERQIFVSGPEPMVDALKSRLLETGLDESMFHGDWFPGYSEKY